MVAKNQTQATAQVAAFKNRKWILPSDHLLNLQERKIEFSVLADG